MGKKGIRSDIPYADRLLMEKYNTVREHRNDAARTALKIGCVALNNTEKLGYARLVRYAMEQQSLTEEYYRDPEVEEVHLNDRLRQIGFVMKDGKMLGAVDADGKPVKMEDLAEASKGSDPVQFWSGWIKVKDRMPQTGKDVLVVVGGAESRFVGVDCLTKNGEWEWFSEGEKIEYWMPMPDLPVE